MDETRSRSKILAKQLQNEDQSETIETILSTDRSYQDVLHSIIELRRKKEFERALQLCRVLLETKDPDIETLVHIQISKIHIKSQNVFKALKELELACINAKDPKLKSKCDKKINKIRTNNLYKQLITFQNLNSNYQMIPGTRFYLISTKWHSLWIDYIYSKAQLPGRIDNSNIISQESSKDYHLHKDPEYLYANTFLKNNLQEEKDYIICTENAYKHLDGIYSHKSNEIIRYCIKINEKDTRIEVNLKKLTIVIYPPVFRIRGAEKALAVSHTDTIKNVTNILKRTLSPYFDSNMYDKDNLRLWKMNPDLKLNRVSSTEILVPGVILDINETIENSSISDEDFIIVEYCSTNGKWLLSPKRIQTTKEARAGLVGLQNLGNTCFMNSALQCVCHTEFIKSYFLQSDYKNDLNFNNPLGTKGAELARTFANLVVEVWNGNTSTISPWDFKKVISKFASQFTGYQQHDSHELLSYLITGLHEDLNRVKTKMYLEIPELNPDYEDENAAKIHWDVFTKRNQSVIVDNMFGQCKSTLICPDCNKVSVTFDPVLSFSVVIPNSDIKKIIINVVLLDLSKPIIRHYVTVKGSWTISKIKSLLSAHYQSSFLIACYEKGNFCGIASDDVEISDYFLKPIYAYEDTMDEGIIVPIIITKAGEKGYFTGTEKRIVCTPKILKIPANSTAQDIQNLIKARFSFVININQNIEDSYKLYIVNTSKTIDGFLFSSKAPCDFCKKKCKNCLLGHDNKKTLKEMIESRVNSEGPFLLELEWSPSSKALNTFNSFSDEKLSLNEPIIQTSASLSLIECLAKASGTEKLDENNKWYCSQCKAHVRALKTYQIFKLPKYLILHLMRFKSKHFLSEKNNTFVEFPLEGLDMSNVVISQNKPGLYDLYAVSNHFGSLGGGHYTAFVKHSETWLEMDDSRVSQVSPDKVVSNSAYVLFYKQRD